METLKTKRGFPNTHHGSMVCPFCGDCGGDIENVNTFSSYVHKAVDATIRFRCWNGCYWELRIGSEHGQLNAPECVLLELHEEMLRDSISEDILCWLPVQKALSSDEPA